MVQWAGWKGTEKNDKKLDTAKKKRQRSRNQNPFHKVIHSFRNSCQTATKHISFKYKN